MVISYSLYEVAVRVAKNLQINFRHHGFPAFIL